MDTVKLTNMVMQYLDRDGIWLESEVFAEEVEVANRVTELSKTS